MSEICHKFCKADKLIVVKLRRKVISILSNLTDEASEVEINSLCGLRMQTMQFFISTIFLEFENI